MLAEKYEEAKRLLIENRVALDRIAEYLFEKETITGKQFMEILNEVRPMTTETTDEIKF